MNGICVTRLAPDDWRLYRDIRLRALTGCPDAFGSLWENESAFSESDWRQRLERVDCVTLVATVPDKDGYGLIVGGPYDSEAGVFSMWVDPEVRGCGVADELIGGVVSWARKQGNANLLLDVGDFNLPAIMLYRRHGFERTGVVGKLPPPREHLKEHQLLKKLGK